jgi:uncharacterized protein YyaL (SSP411 family)
MGHPKFSNELAKESSPYLLQHAHNPVCWFPWKEHVLAKAKEENKLLLISIGYSTCHWCHVMEEECFENEAVAKVMNGHFINIKVDREERPDVDQVYMNALQLMTGGGGWPLNIVALPDGRPVWGATYLPKEQWIDVLNQLQKLHKNQAKSLIEYAGKMEQGIQTMDLITLQTGEIDFSKFDYDEIISFWARQFDQKYGGTKRAPKFMMPNNYHFLLRYAFQNNNEVLMDHVHLTLEKMAYGGIFDHINGGFSRYSVDEKWHIPHFEKMLYDNAQLVSLYCDAFLQSKNDLYKEVVYETLDFIKRELTDASGGFYSALDADSINEHGILEEGAFYVFTKKELEEQLKEDFYLFSAYYNINDFGKWEKDHYVLIRNASDLDFAAKHDLSLDELNQIKKIWKAHLREHRKIKARPRLDYKILTSWNAIMIKAYTDAYSAFQESSFLDSALKCAHFINENLISDDFCLSRNITHQMKGVDGFLDDYAFLSEAFIALYEITFEEKWANLSKNLIDYCFTNFYDKDTSMFYYTNHKNESLISRTIDSRDNVIPASNSVMAKNLYWLGLFFNNTTYTDTAKQMLKNIVPEIKNYPPGYSNWLELMMNFSHPYYEIVLSGKEFTSIAKQLSSNYLPNLLIAGSKSESKLPLLKDRNVKNKTFIYVCEKGSCKLPAQNMVEALQNIRFS